VRNFDNAKMIGDMGLMGMMCLVEPSDLASRISSHPTIKEHRTETKQG